MSLSEHVAAAEEALHAATLIPDPNGDGKPATDRQLATASVHAQLALALADGGAAQKVLDDLLADLREQPAAVVGCGDLVSRLEGALAALTGGG